MSTISEFGPGHFDFTFMCGDRGINEIDLLLLKHLIHYKKVLRFRSRFILYVYLKNSLIVPSNST